MPPDDPTRECRNDAWLRGGVERKIASFGFAEVVLPKNQKLRRHLARSRYALNK